MSGGWLGGRRIGGGDLTHDGNIFTALRWLLAASVMFTHGWDLTQPQVGLDPTVALLTIPVSELAVNLFFSLSGFLVAGSLIKRGVRDYALSRALRLVPGLWVMLLVTTIGLGLIFAPTSFAAYLTDPQTWRYVLRNASLLVSEYRLPGIFDSLPIPGVNGSLWTIPREVMCYIALALLGAVGALRSRAVVVVLLVAGTLLHLALPADAIPALQEPRRLAVSFFLGVAAFQWRDRLRLSWPLALAGAAVALGVAHLRLPGTIGAVAIQIAFAYLTLVVAILVPRAWKRASAALPDYSYGIYIYAFPAQQTVLALGIGVAPLANIGWGLALTLPFAALSWHLIESPALALKPRLTRRATIKVSV